MPATRKTFTPTNSDGDGHEHPENAANEKPIPKKPRPKYPARLYKCLFPECDYTSTKGNVRTHGQSMHLSGPNFECPRCHKTQNAAAAIIAHQKSKHPGMKVVPSGDCKTPFLIARELAAQARGLLDIPLSDTHAKDVKKLADSNFMLQNILHTGSVASSNSPVASVVSGGSEGLPMPRVSEQRGQSSTQVPFIGNAGFDASRRSSVTSVDSHTSGMAGSNQRAARARYSTHPYNWVDVEAPVEHYGHHGDGSGYHLVQHNMADAYYAPNGTPDNVHSYGGQYGYYSTQQSYAPAPHLTPYAPPQHPAPAGYYEDFAAAAADVYSEPMASTSAHTLDYGCNQQQQEQDQEPWLVDDFDFAGFLSGEY
ncbi:hypothetical protein CYLTODRAFT_490999 [Cylindrobasidium torrendii FP15055 ss-10]|uniref:C2H2-type domain-containing protein n=1 Tax=Cylindrobasidium torrendii FP15055 ss-10 TaxID=1314674 RepID=A0A0D7B9Q5_9AGAR|nr:hypothetical protein CYLTODRAFT_490999 [Cylindrobasidium torrendii FP15055 ss-10]